jgi:predicted nucleotidyltransferase
MDNITHKSGLVKKEIQILFPFIKEPWKEFTTTQIKAITKNKSHHYVYAALKKFYNLGIILEETKGKTNIYHLNFRNLELQYIALAENLIKESRTDIPRKNIEEIMKTINNPFYTLIICGSYAEKAQKKSSDLDVAIIIPNSDNKKSYEASLREGELLVPEIHGYVFTKKEFIQMLTNDEFNYGKEIAKKHIIYHGVEAYYKMLFEAIKNGFKIGDVHKKGEIRAGISANPIHRVKGRKNKA